MLEVHEFCFYLGFLVVFGYHFVVIAYCFKQLYWGENPDPNREGPLDLLTPRLEMESALRKRPDKFIDPVIDIANIGHSFKSV